MRHVPTLDSTGLHALRQVVRRSRADGTAVYLAEVQPGPLAVLAASTAGDEIGRDSIVSDIEDAIRQAEARFPS
jgi:sulfate permease, SulP family